MATQQTALSASPPKAERRDATRIIGQFAPLIFLFVLIVIFAIATEGRFLNPLNIFNVLRQVSITGMIALGMTFVILTGGIDLSVGSLLALAGMAAAIAFKGTNQNTLSLETTDAVGLGVAGAAIVIGFSLRSGAGHIAIGDAYLFIAALSAAIGYVVSAELTRDMPGWEVISWVCVVMLPATVALSLVWWPAEMARVTTAGWVSLAYLALFSQFIGFFAWNAGLALGGVAGVSQVQLLQTFFTIGFAALINGEAIGLETVLVAGVIVVILFLGRRARVA